MEEQTVHDFASAYWDLWIVPINNQIMRASGQQKRKLQKEKERLLKDREKQIIERFGKLP